MKRLPTRYINMILLWLITGMCFLSNKEKKQFPKNKKKKLIHSFYKINKIYRLSYEIIFL
ncbi:Hypothetical protein Minf_0782 [Methylacidiphilum infernorum V4]|uniref:Uncharacterized protein n=1 Tax=Methylacidiphilum infernorum (isolate V4) TaxID=481448 RepID=B3E141_METI4|nr:Hypothetical protein Minf_0782 [Methylacidiphilum infernorum V4]